jgi:NADH-quinone oxidoreductase subunit H
VTELSLRLAVSLAQIAAVMGIVMLTVMILTLAERKVLGWMQDRMGPMEVGPYGILQPIADGLKLFFKEDIVPAGANKFMFSLAPILAMVPALIGFAVIPFGPNETIQLFGMTIKPFVISDINIGVLYILAFASIGAYGIILGGWASNSKYSLLGGLRSAAQIISYELNVGLAIVGVLIMAGSLSLVKITDAQAGGFWHWYVFAFPAPQIFAFVVYVISAVAETNRVPFDLPEAESELVAGFFEYSGMRAFLYRGIRQHGVGVLRRRGPVPRRMECSLSRHDPRSYRPGVLRLDRRGGLVHRESVRVSVPVLLAARHASAFALRSADEVRLESHAPDRVGQHRGDGIAMCL